MKFSWQNLDDGVIKKHIAHGRAWWKIFRVEWTFPSWGSWSFSFGVNGGDSHDELTFSLCCGLFALYFGIEAFKFPFGNISCCDNKTFLHGERKFIIALHDGGVWLNLWEDWRGSSEGFWQKTWYFNPLDLLFGYPKHSERVIEEGEVLVPMPEGCYEAKYKRFVSKWKRSRSIFKREIERVTLDVPKGIPHEGKGENSYDCGEDATYGFTTPARTIESAVGQLVSSVLRDRKRYGGSHLHRKLTAVKV